MDGLTEGRMVHYVPSDAPDEHRAAVVCRVWSKAEGMVNLKVFWDGENDAKRQDYSVTGWVTSRRYDENMAPSTWHWIEKA